MIIRKVAFMLLWLMIFSIPWQNIIVIPGLGTFTRFVGFAAVGFAGMYVLVKKQIKEPPLFFIIIVFFVIWSFITIFWSINQGATIIRIVTYVQLLAMIWLMWELCDSRRDMLIFMQAYVLGSYIVIIDMILTLTAITGTAGRIVPEGFNANDVAAPLAVGIALAWYLFLQNQRGKVSWVNIVYIPLSLFCIILTGTRGGLVVAFFTLLIVPFTLFTLNTRGRYIVVASLIIFAVSGSLYLPSIYLKIEENVERMTTITGEIQEGTPAGVGRATIWKAGLRVYRENPIVGVGARGFRYAVIGSTVYHPTRDSYFVEPKSSHNTFLSVLVDTGLIGFLIFLSVLLIAFLPVLYLNSYHRTFSIILFIALIISMIPMEWEANKTVWYVLSLLTLQSAFILRHRKFCVINRSL